MPELQNYAELSFVTQLKGGKLDLWTPERPGGHSAGNEMGQQYAAELLAFMQEHEDAHVFGAVLGAITTRGAYESVEVGFFNYFGGALIGIGRPPKPRGVRFADAPLVEV